MVIIVCLPPPHMCYDLHYWLTAYSTGAGTDSILGNIADGVVDLDTNLRLNQKGSNKAQIKP